MDAGDLDADKGFVGTNVQNVPMERIEEGNGETLTLRGCPTQGRMNSELAGDHSGSPLDIVDRFFFFNSVSQN